FCRAQSLQPRMPQPVPPLRTGCYLADNLTEPMSPEGMSRGGAAGTPGNVLGSLSIIARSSGPGQPSRMGPAALVEPAVLAWLRDGPP
ncbi:MAG TPA: hypothetical protein VJK29_12125, partial [Terriglobales bacterium]|nr:hypothetical protein [Terriglobales bacterium]